VPEVCSRPLQSSRGKTEKKIREEEKAYGITPEHSADCRYY